jgi:hypothetical protein
VRSAILFILLSRCLSAQDAAGIEGLAIDAVTRLPMAGVHINMRTAADLAYGAISKQDGHFSIGSMPPELYFVAAEYNGYVYVPTDRSVVLKPGERRTDFTVEMTPRASIAGRVLDEFGDPVQNVHVEAIPATSGPRLGPFRMTARTDERGQFRMTGVPGKFYVRTLATNPDEIPEIRTDGLGPPVYGDTWHPGSESKDRASVVEVAAGRDLNGIDIHLARKRSLTISGVVTGIPENLGPVRVFLFSNEITTREVVAGWGGKFAVPGVTPGHYRMLAQLDALDALMGSRPLDLQLDGADKTGVSLALEKGEILTGTLEISGDPAPPALAEALTVRLESLSLDDRLNMIQPKGGGVDREGAFRIEQVFPGTFRVRVLPMPENGFVKSVKLDNVETNDDVLDLSRGVGGAGMKVTVSRNGGQVEGPVLGEDGEALHIPFVYVFFATAPEEIDFDRLNPVEAGAKFKFSGLRPGKYRLMAIDPRQFDGVIGSVGIRTMFSKAQEVEIREGDRITKDVRVMTVENPGAKP